MSERRALPAAVFVPEKTMINIARKVASLPADKRTSHRIVLVKAGRYRASTDQVVTYNHESSLPRQYPKADIVHVQDCLASEIPLLFLDVLGVPENPELLIEHLRTFWDESIETDTPITVMICTNLRGSLVDYYVSSFDFLNKNPSLHE